MPSRLDISNAISILEMRVEENLKYIENNKEILNEFILDTIIEESHSCESVAGLLKRIREVFYEEGDL